MEGEGVVGEIVFPNTVPPFFKTSVLICGNPSRRGLPAAPRGDPRPQPLARRLVRRVPGAARRHRPRLPERHRRGDRGRAAGSPSTGCAAASCCRTCRPTAPTSCRSTRRSYDRFWAVCQDLDVVINQHGGTGSPDYGRVPGLAADPAARDAAGSRPAATRTCCSSGVFERFPKLRYIVTESGCAWVPATLAAASTGSGAACAPAPSASSSSPKGVDAAEPPSFYAQAQLLLRRQRRPRARELAGRQEIGVDRLLWGSDYPHYEGTYPNTREVAAPHLPRRRPRAEVRASSARTPRASTASTSRSWPRSQPASARPPTRSRPRSRPKRSRKNVHTNAFR